MQQIIAALLCHGCEQRIHVHLADMRVEKTTIVYRCEDCGTMSRRFDRDTLATMTDWDVVYGTRISQREADKFARDLKRIERFWDELLEP